MSEKHSTFYGWGGDFLDPHRLRQIARKLNTLTRVYTGDTEAMEMAHCLDRVAAAMDACMKAPVTFKGMPVVHNPALPPSDVTIYDPRDPLRSHRK